MGLTKYKGWLPDEPWNAENANSIDPENVVPQAAGYLTGGNNISLLSVWQALGVGANNGKFKAVIDGDVYDNIAVDANISIAETTMIDYQVESAQFSLTLNNRTGQHFTISEDCLITSFSVRFYNGPTYYRPLAVQFYLADSNGLPTGSPIQSWSRDVVVGNLTTQNFALTTPVSATAGQKYVAVFYRNGDQSNQVYGSTSGGIANGNVIRSTDGGVNWTQEVNSDLFFILYTKKNSTYFNSLVANIQAGIRTATSKLETVALSAGRFIITSATTGLSSKVLKFLSPSTGTDISGAGATPYLDCADNATETHGAGEDFNLVRLTKDAKIPEELVFDKKVEHWKFISSASGTSVAIPPGTCFIIVNFEKYGSGGGSSYSSGGSCILSTLGGPKSFTSGNMYYMNIRFTTTINADNTIISGDNATYSFFT